MPSTKHALGQGMMGSERYGDGLSTGIRPLTQVLGLTYTATQSQYGAAIGLTYSAQAPNVGILQLYFQVTPAQDFAINGDTTIVSPDQVTYTPIPVVARTLLANPIIQGYKVMIWTYTLLQLPEAQYLLSFYNPTSPLVVLTYPNDDGIWVQRRASMLPPGQGNRETVEVEDFSLSFLLLTD